MNRKFTVSDATVISGIIRTFVTQARFRLGRWLMCGRSNTSVPAEMPANLVKLPDIWARHALHGES